MTWPECELIERAEKILLQQKGEPEPSQTVNIVDLMIYRTTSADDIYIFRNGKLVMGSTEGRSLPGETREDFLYALEVLRRFMVLDDLADV